jgi:hypothetical protein
VNRKGSINVRLSHRTKFTTSLQLGMEGSFPFNAIITYIG